MTASTPTFTVERLGFATLTELPHSWQAADYRALLAQLNFDNPNALPEAELKEMCQMALTDLEPRSAAVAVLTYLFPEELTVGQVENLAHQMLTERLWEENPDLAAAPWLLPSHTTAARSLQWHVSKREGGRVSGEMHGPERG
jgi:hypothetical protein